jgi:hypothetical protein
MADDQFDENRGDIDLPTEEPLPQDYGSPTAPPDEQDDEVITADHPATDTNLDQQEIYEEGRAGATDALAQHVGSDEDEERGI